MDSLLDVCNTLMEVVDSPGSDLDHAAIRAGARAAAVARRAAAMADNREGLGMRVIAVMVQRYGVLPKELWDLNSISDMGAGRGVFYHRSLPAAMYASIINNNRYNIFHLIIGEDITHEVELPDSLKQLTISSRTYNFQLNPLPANLQDLLFNWNCTYDKRLDLPVNLRVLKLSRYYNHPITFPMGSELVEFEVGSEYNQPLVLPQRLKWLSFDWPSEFDQALTLPQSLRFVEFGASYNKPTILPNGIEEIGVGEDFSNDISLPNSLRKIVWRCDCAIQIPEGVGEVEFNDPFNKPVTFASTLKKVTFAGIRYTQPLTFPQNLEELEWHIRDYEGLVLPEHLQKLTWASTCNVTLPSGLKELVLRANAPLVLPENLREITINATGSRRLYMIDGVSPGAWSNNFDQELTFTHPTTLQHLVLGNLGYSRDVDLSGYRIDKLTIVCHKAKITAWPQGLKELVLCTECPLPVPKGCRIVGARWPANLMIE